MDTIPGKTLKVGDGKSWAHNGEFLGKLLKFQLVGHPYDPESEYTFEHGCVVGLGLQFTEVKPAESS